MSLRQYLFLIHDLSSFAKNKHSFISVKSRAVFYINKTTTTTTSPSTEHTIKLFQKEFLSGCMLTSLLLIIIINNYLLIVLVMFHLPTVKQVTLEHFSEYKIFLHICFRKYVWRVNNMPFPSSDVPLAVCFINK